MALQLYDTYARQLREFEPLHPPQVGLYACGLTVYDYAHIGNLRTYIFEDILRRVLIYNGYTVNHVVNITDVGHLTSDADTGEDKMEKGSRRTGKTAWELADYYTDVFKGDINALNILEPSIWCKATDHIDEQIALIQCMEAKGFTYRTEDGIYFDSSQIDDYGYIARLNTEGQQAGIRIDASGKRNPTDFALWKFSPADAQRQMEWDSPWGVGFPGWHIECSAMAEKYLGTFFDIHCGGEDHIPVHHTNEIAQTQACHNTRLANFWMHGYFLQLSNAKMSKSSGDFLRLQTLIDKGYDPLAYRYYCLNSHYRAKLTFSWEGMDGAKTTLNRLRTAVHKWGEPGQPEQSYVERFTAVINQDLNMPQALALVWELVKSNVDNGIKKATMLEFDKVLGLGLADWQPVQDEIPDEIVQLATQRQQARAEKRWQDADALRDQIAT
ncbi:MAG: cysteine--tRNA ligase, partial [Chloroflexi bacterium]|nr:cysteine--tRNA ligase [Chloroflexota bacterium]